MIERRQEDKKKTLDVVIDGGIFPEFAKLTRDNNPMHTNREYAMKQEIRPGEFFKDTPAQAVLLQSYFEECALINGCVSNDQNRFRFSVARPTYPGDRLKFGPDCLNGLDIFSAINQRGVRVATYSEIPSKKIKIEDSWDLVGSFSDTISKGDVNKFYQLTGIERRDRVPHTLLFSLVPASLLKLASDVDGMPVGTFKKIYPNFYREPQVGSVKTNVYLVKAQERKGHNVYRFFVTCRDQEALVTSGEATVTCPVKLELEAIAA